MATPLQLSSLPRSLLAFACLTALAAGVITGAVRAEPSAASPVGVDPGRAGTTAVDHETSESPEHPWRWPLDPTPEILERFDPPEEQWSAGHRGIDLAGRIGQPVRAVDDGMVTYSGMLAGRGVVVVSHGEVRSTYEPVTASVARGDSVVAGQVIGLLQVVRSHCLPAACLHLGARVGSAYLDPEKLLAAPQVRLKPLAGLPADDAASLQPPLRAGSWRAPVGLDAPITSGFGNRSHPLTGQSSFHDGVDLGVDCGTPIVAAVAGVVIGAEADPIYGHHIALAHGGGLETRYGHMYRAGVLVSVGDRVQAGQVVGTVGSDGWSTGCHLHFSVTRYGRPIDPVGVGSP